MNLNGVRVRARARVNNRLMAYGRLVMLVTEIKKIMVIVTVKTENK